MMEHVISAPPAPGFLPTRWQPNRIGETGAGASRSSEGGFLNGHTVLVIEDDLIVGLELAQMLEDMGASVIGPIPSLTGANAAVAAGGFDIAILDVNIGGKYSFGIAEDLESRQVPVLFATAYAADDKLFPPATQNIPRVPKPVQPMALLGALRRVM